MTELLTVPYNGIVQLKRSGMSKERLNDLYWNKKLTLKEISKILNCSTRTIGVRMEECGIARRLPGIAGPVISKEDVYNLYILGGLSSRKIAKIYGCAYSTIDRKIKELGFPVKTLSAAHITSKRLQFSGNKNEESYLIGFRIGDLRVRKKYKNSETILIDCASTKKAQIDLIRILFEPNGRIWISKPNKNNKIQIECAVDDSFSFLLHKHAVIPTSILKNRQYFLSFLAGFIDAEGSFFITNQKRAVFSLGNYNKEILEQIYINLQKAGFRMRLFKGVKMGYTGKDGYSHNSDYWILNIDRKHDLLKFAKFIRKFLRHSDRIACLDKVVENINTRNELYG